MSGGPVTSNTPVTQRECALLHSSVTDQLDFLKESVAGFHDTLDGLVLSHVDIRKDIQMVAKDAATAAKQSTDTNGRVRELEKWRSYLLGGMTVVTFGMGIGAGYVVLVT